MLRKLILSSCLGAAMLGQEPARESWVPMEMPADPHALLCHKDFLRFWRIQLPRQDHGHGNWHLYNAEDDEKFVKEVATGKWPAYRLEWTAVEGKLPK